MTDKKNSSDRLSNWIGPILFLAFLALYSVTLTRGVHPGDSARLVAQVLGIEPFGTTLYPIWRTLAAIVAAITRPDSTVLALNLLSALFSAGGVWLMYELVSRLPHWDGNVQNNIAPSKKAARYSGIAAALFLGLCAPYWLTATQAHHLPLETLMFLGASLLFLSYVRQNSDRLLFVFVFCYGIGVVESVLFIVASPFFAISVILLRAMRDRLTIRFFTKLVLLFLAGSLLYFYAALRIYLSPLYEWFDYTNFFPVIWAVWRDQYHLMRGGLGQLGWLIIFLVSAMPCLVVLVTPHLLTTYRFRQFGPLIFHLTITALAVLLLFNLHVAPWALMGRASLIVFPYLLWAIYAGYLVGYWYILFGGRYAPRQVRDRIRVLRPVWLVAVAAAIGFSAYLNAQEMSRRDVRHVHAFVAEALDLMGDRTWLISNGIADHTLLVAAHEREQPLHVLNLQLGRNPIYLKYVATLLDDPRDQSLASVGLMPLITSWLETDERIHERLAVLTWEEAWSAHGFYPVPEGVFFGGARSTDDIDLDALHTRYHTLWQNFEPFAAREEAVDGGLLAAMADWIRLHMSRVSNNYGVLLEELGRSERAYEAYQQARILNPDSISALLNIASLAHRLEHEDSGQLDEEIKKLEELPDHHLRHWALVARYGAVRFPEAYARRGMAWAMSGKADIAIADIQRAIQAGADREGLSFVLASLYFADEQFDESERAYAQILRTQPDNPEALFGMARIAIRRGHFDLARGYLARLNDLGAMPTRVRLEEGILEVIAGNEREGRRLLEALVKDQPGLTHAWAILVMVALGQDDEPLLARSLQALGELGAMDVRSLMIIAHAQISRRQLKEARSTLERVLRVQPVYVPAYEQLLRLDVAEMDRDAARRRIEAILSIDSRNALAHYVLGSIHYATGNLMLAESAYRSSVGAAPTAESLNDLAWVLHLRGEHEESLGLVRRALEINPESPVTWHTHGTILMHRNEYEDALAAFGQSLRISPDALRLHLSFAQLYERMGRREDAITHLDRVLEQVSVLPERDRQEAIDLSARLRRL